MFLILGRLLAPEGDAVAEDFVHYGYRLAGDKISLAVYSGQLVLGLVAYEYVKPARLTEVQLVEVALPFRFLLREEVVEYLGVGLVAGKDNVVPLVYDDYGKVGGVYEPVVDPFL